MGVVVTRRDLINGGHLSNRISGRLIPKRGQVKLGIVMGLFHSFSSGERATSRCVHLSSRISGRLILKRGQVKLGIVMGLFHPFTNRCVHLS